MRILQQRTTFLYNNRYTIGSSAESFTGIVKPRFVRNLWWWVVWLSKVINPDTWEDESLEDVEQHRVLIQVGVHERFNKLVMLDFCVCPVHSWVHVMDRMISIVVGKKIQDWGSEIPWMIVIGIWVTSWEKSRWEYGKKNKNKWIGFYHRVGAC